MICISLGWQRMVVKLAFEAWEADVESKRSINQAHWRLDPSKSLLDSSELLNDTIF